MISIDCVVDVQQSCLGIGSEEVRLEQSRVCVRVMATETWLVPPKSKAIIPGVTARLKEDGEN